jgi:hypothetical protein
MPQTRPVIEEHLNNAKAALAARAQVLSGKKLDDKAKKRDATYRRLHAEVKKYTSRLKSLEKYLAICADVDTRRAERLATPKKKKEKKKKAPVEAKPKAKGERKPKAEAAAAE